MQKEFAKKVIDILKDDPNIAGLAAGGSWITNSIDEYSDIDFVLVTYELISNDSEKMLSYAKKFGSLINYFDGGHVGEKRLLICLYDNPFLHVDIKFVTLDEFRYRVEDPVILFDRAGDLKQVLSETKSNRQFYGYQWIEDRFWTWIHYLGQKIGRGEYFEALEMLSFLRQTVIAQLLQIKNKQLPRALRKVEFSLEKSDLHKLTKTVPSYSPLSIVEASDETIKIYRQFRKELYPDTIILNKLCEEKCYSYFKSISEKVKQNETRELVSENNRKVILYIAQSLDGYISKPNDDLSFLSKNEIAGEDYGYNEFSDTIDTVIMGRKTYDWILSQPVQFPYHDKEVYVITRNQKSDNGNIHFYSGNIKELIKELKSKPGKNIFAVGAAEIVDLLLSEQLIDEIQLFLFPILLSKGIAIFRNNKTEQNLKLLSSKEYGNGIVRLHYIKI